MTTRRRFNISLPDEIAEVVEEKIRTGAYATASEVVLEGARALQDRDAAVGRWLREEVAPGHAEYLADPSKGVPAGEVLRHIKARRAAATAS